MATYGNAQQVIRLTGAKPKSLGFDTDGDLLNLIEERLVIASAYIESDRLRTFDEIAHVALAGDIAERIAANYIRAMERQRNKSIVTIDGGELEVASDEPTVITQSIRDDIKRLPRAAKWRMINTLTKVEAEEPDEV